jgi:hypothetical protein
MSLCYDFQKWTILTLGLVAISLSVGLLLQVVHGIGEPAIPASTCAIYDGELLKILVIGGNSCPNIGDAISIFLKAGWHIASTNDRYVFMTK